MLEAIYHPYYMPDIVWYKTQLLLWDKIYRIVPYSVKKTFGPKSMASLWNIPEEHVPIVEFKNPDNQYFEDRKYAIKRQLLKLSREKVTQYKIEKEEVYLNIDKVPEWVGDTLLEYGLRKEGKSEKWGWEHYEVREDASDFLMSCVAHSMGQDRGMSPLTNKELNCFATYGNQIGTYGEKQPSGESLRTLIAGIFDITVPKEIDNLTSIDVLDIREEYADLRKAVVRVIESLSDAFHLCEVVEKKRAKMLVKDALKEFKGDVDKFKKRRWRRAFRDWKIQTVVTTLGMLPTYIAGGSNAAIAWGTAGYLLTVINHYAGREEPRDIKKTIQYFNEINKTINKNKFIEGLMNYRRFVVGEM